MFEKVRGQKRFYVIVVNCLNASGIVKVALKDWRDITWRHWWIQRTSGKIVLNLVRFSSQSWRCKLTKWNQHLMHMKNGKSDPTNIGVNIFYVRGALYQICMESSFLQLFWIKGLWFFVCFIFSRLTENNRLMKKEIQ